MANNPTISQIAKINIDNNKNKSIDYYDLACEARNIKHFMGKATRANGTPSGGVVINAPYNDEDKAFEYKISPASISSPKDVTFNFENLTKTQEIKKKYALFFFNLHCSRNNYTSPLYFFMLRNDNLEHTLTLKVLPWSLSYPKSVQLYFSYKLDQANLKLELTQIYDDNDNPTDKEDYTLSNMRLTYNIF
ncbi:MAG: hypothetical protein MSA65_03665 [Mollicutes bacterium]|nr:hypothetical protein [Mollicutes bacterium]